MYMPVIVTGESVSETAPYPTSDWHFRGNTGVTKSLCKTPSAERR